MVMICFLSSPNSGLMHTSSVYSGLQIHCAILHSNEAIKGRKTLFQYFDNVWSLMTIHVHSFFHPCVPPSQQNKPSLCRAVTGSTSEGWGRPIPGPHLRSPLETFEDCVHCGNKYHDSTMCPTTFTLERCTYCNGNRHSPTQCPSIIAQAFNYAPRVKATPIPIPPKPEEGVPTSSCYPERAIKPLPRRAREPRP
jgi:hypothetical protein